MGNAGEASTTNEDGADGVDEIVHGVDVGGQVRPVGHGARRREEPAEQHQADDEEPHHEDGLLQGVAVVADEQAERREEQGEQHGEHVDEPQRSLAGDAIDGTSQQQTDGDDEKGNEPVGNELGQDERPLRNGCDVDLLDGAGFLLAHYVQGGQESTHEHHDDG